MKSASQQRSPALSNIITVVRVVSGNFFEMYDYILFGIFAKDIARVYFPLDDPYLSELLAYAVFWLGSVMRPVGALVLGGYIDRVGRRKGLVLTLGIMATGTAVIAFLPGYASIGVLAPVLVLVGRLLEGFSAGVELGGVSVYLAEIAPPGRKGFYVSWQSGSQQVAVVAATALGIFIRQELPPESLSAWGWRIPFVVGSLIVPILFLIRRSLQETEEFVHRGSHPRFVEICRSILANWTLIIAGMGWVLMTTVFFYFITSYTPSFGAKLHLSPGQGLVVTLCVGVSNLCFLPLSGALSDRVGRAPLLLVCSALGAATAFPALYWLCAHPSFGHLLAVELWFSLLYGGYNGAMTAALVEVMPPTVRATGFSLAYSLATLAGTFTDIGSTWLSHNYGNAAPGIWLLLAAAGSLAATAWFWRKGLLART